MTEESGRVNVLSDEDQKKALRWLRSKGVSLQCESCGQDNFVPGPVVRAVGIDLSKGEADWDNPSIATFQMLCNNCGYVRNYSAGMIGLL